MPSPRSNQRSRWPALVLVVLLLLPMLYALSVGPAFQLLNGDNFHRYYAPAKWIAREVPGMRAPFRWWIEVWEDLLGQPD